MKLVIATKNKNKILEIRNKYSELSGLEIMSLSDFRDVPDIIEDGSTFEENALKKARAYSAFTGLPVLSDDSGLEIDALGGEPGIYSARYAGINAGDEENIDLVLMKLQGIPEKERTSRFVCVVAIVLQKGKEYTAKGICEGIITDKRAGHNGFGYDPVFYIPSFGRTMAELSMQEKNRISHRALALDKAGVILKKIMTE